MNKYVSERKKVITRHYSISVCYFQVLLYRLILHEHTLVFNEPLPFGPQINSTASLKTLMACS